MRNRSAIDNLNAHIRSCNHLHQPRLWTSIMILLLANKLRADHAYLMGSNRSYSSPSSYLLLCLIGRMTNDHPAWPFLLHKTYFATAFKYLVISSCKFVWRKSQAQKGFRGGWYGRVAIYEQSNIFEGRVVWLQSDIWSKLYIVW